MNNHILTHEMLDAGHRADTIVAGQSSAQSVINIGTTDTQIAV